MHQHHSGSHGHHDHHHHHHDKEDHDHEHADEKQSKVLSMKERLIMRLQYSIRHNREHGDSYENLAREAREMGEEEAGRLLLAAAEFTARQNEHLETALSLLTTAR